MVGVQSEGEPSARDKGLPPPERGPSEPTGQRWSLLDFPAELCAGRVGKGHWGVTEEDIKAQRG